MSTDRGGGRSIVVGVDGTGSARAALRFALEEGLARGATVEIVTTWLRDGTLRERVTEDDLAREASSVRLAQDKLLAEAAAGLERLPVISQRVLHDAGGGPLVELAKDAALLVVGTGRKSLLSRAFLGSVSEYCVRHARVPVVVVPDPVRLSGHSRSYADSASTGRGTVASSY